MTIRTGDLNSWASAAGEAPSAARPALPGTQDAEFLEHVDDLNNECSRGSPELDASSLGEHANEACSHPDRCLGSEDGAKASGGAFQKSVDYVQRDDHEQHAEEPAPPLHEVRV